MVTLPLLYSIKYLMDKLLCSYIVSLAFAEKMFAVVTTMKPVYSVTLGPAWSVLIIKVSSFSRSVYM